MRLKLGNFTSNRGHKLPHIPGKDVMSQLFIYLFFFTRNTVKKWILLFYHAAFCDIMYRY